MQTERRRQTLTTRIVLAVSAGVGFGTYLFGVMWCLAALGGLMVSHGGISAHRLDADWHLGRFMSAAGMIVTLVSLFVLDAGRRRALKILAIAAVLIGAAYVEWSTREALWQW